MPDYYDSINIKNLKIMKKLHILYIVFAIIAIFFIGKTIYNLNIEKNTACHELYGQVKTLQLELEKKQSIIDSLQINSWLFEDYYCSAENLLDTIFHHYIIDGVFVFEYEPYTISSNSIWAYEELYNYLETKRNSWK